MFNSVPHSTTKWSPASPKRENQSSLCTFVRLSPMCLYYLRSASLQALATLRRRHPPPLPPLPPILHQPTPCRTPPFVLDPLNPTCSAPPPFPNLIPPNCAVCSQQAAALRNFILCARLIIRRALHTRLSLFHYGVSVVHDFLVSRCFIPLFHRKNHYDPDRRTDCIVYQNRQ